MEKGPLDIISQKDPELFKNVTEAGKYAYADGALSGKHKLLIAIALDAAQGAENGVKSLAMQAMKAGATKEEILESVRVAYYICGVGCVYTAANGLKDII